MIGVPHLSMSHPHFQAAAQMGQAEWHADPYAYAQQPYAQQQQMQPQQSYAQQQQMQPQQPIYYDAVAAFMEQIGVNAGEEEHLGWIAECGLQSPLPSRWESCVDLGTGCTYYVEQETQTSTWEHPLLPYLRRLVEFGREFLSSPQEGFFDEAKRRIWQEQRDELELWHGPFDSSNGRQYYVNSGDGTTSTRDPREGAQQAYELQSALLYRMEEVLGPFAGNAPSTPGSHWGEQEGSSGAQVLSLEEPSTNTSRGSRRLATLRQNAKVDHTSTLQSMMLTADRLRTACLEEEEAQRLKLSKLVEARRRRAQRRDVSPPPLCAVTLSTAACPAAEGLGSKGRPAPMAQDIDTAPVAPVPPPMCPPSPANLMRPPPPESSPPPPL